MKRKRNGLFYSKKEETINSISHGIGIAMGVIVSTLFLIKCYQVQNLWAAIYWHIAGSYSPITLIALREDGGWGLFGFVWLCAIIGTVVSFRKMEEHSYVETVCYILMGLSVLVVFKQLFALSPTACYWIIAEGVCYITGAAFYSLRKARYMHSVFHFFVLGGSACHMLAVWDILVKML